MTTQTPEPELAALMAEIGQRARAAAAILGLASAETKIAALRAAEIAPHLADPPRAPAFFRDQRDGPLSVLWELDSGTRLTLICHLAPTPLAVPKVRVGGRPIWTSARVTICDGELSELAPWFVGFFISEATPRDRRAALSNG